jgi:aminoglycoside phosphotransferase (APT) family kinase protein
MHRDQVAVSADLVRALVAGQFPEWSRLPVRPVEAAGTENALFRLGDALVARLPLRVRDGDVAAVRRRLEADAEAARELHGRTRFATPEPLAIGEPGAGYELPWAVQSWVPGTPATPAGLATSTAFARDLAELIAGVSAMDTRGRTFAGGGRGGHLPDHDDWLDTCFANSAGLLDVPALRRAWSRLRTLERTAPDVMTHGDLIPGNLLVAGGRLTGVIDVGGLGAADPALDLVAAWHLLDAPARRELRAALGCDDVTWARGQAWAFQQAMGLVWYYERSNPAMSRLGRSTLERILADPA